MDLADVSYLVADIYDHNCKQIGHKDIRPGVFPTYPDKFSLASQLPYYVDFTRYEGGNTPNFGNVLGIAYRAYKYEGNFACDQKQMTVGGKQVWWHWCQHAFPCNGF